MLAKSQKSFNCGDQLLTGKKYFDQGIHCFYYSTLQLMKYKLANLSQGAISYDEQLEKSQNSSSHQYILEKILDQISNREIKNNFRDVFQKLKKFRITADYQLEPMTIDDCLECKNLNERAVGYLRNIH